MKVQPLIRLGVLILLFLVATASCSHEKAILAEYTGGTISRAEFNRWIQHKHLESVLSQGSTENTASWIKAMAVENIAANEAVYNHFDKTEAMILRSEINEDIAISDMLTQSYKTDTRFAANVYAVQYILLKVPSVRRNNSKNESSASADRKIINDMMMRAEEILANISAGKRFEDFTNHAAAERLYFMPQTAPEEMKNLFSMKIGETAARPLYIKATGEIIILKLEDIIEVLPDSINKKITHRGFADKLKPYIEETVRHNYIAQLENKYAGVFYNNALNNTFNNRTVFSIETNIFTVNDIHKRFALYKQISGTSAADAKAVQEHAYSWYISLLMKRDAEKKNILLDKDFIERRTLANKSMLAHEYGKYLVQQKVSVSGKEMRDEFKSITSEQKSLFTRSANSKYLQAKPLLAKKIRERKIQQEESVWRKDILAAHNFNLL
jgi:hypothetical protein